MLEAIIKYYKNDGYKVKFCKETKNCEYECKIGAHHHDHTNKIVYLHNDTSSLKWTTLCIEIEKEY